MARPLGAFAGDIDVGGADHNEWGLGGNDCMLGELEVGTSPSTFLRFSTSGSGGRDRAARLESG